MDVVYVLGKGSRWNDNELRFSLRSIEKNLKGVGKVIIVGERPEFLQNVIHIPTPDIFDPGINADGNIITKVLAACAFDGLSDDFLFINDDHLILKPMDIADVPPIHKGDMTTYEDKYWRLNFWRGRLMRTKDVLLSKGLTTFHFDCHTPIIFNKKKFPEIVRQFNYQTDIGYTMKSLYGNVEYAESGELLTDQKRTIFKHYTVAEITERLKEIPFMAFNDQGLNESLKFWLINTFRSKSRYEQDSPSDIIIDLYHWQLAGKPYWQGVKIFKRYFKNRNLVAMFEMAETEALREKLNFKLMLRLREL